MTTTATGLRAFLVQNRHTGERRTVVAECSTRAILASALGPFNEVSATDVPPHATTGRSPQSTRPAVAILEQP